MVPAPISRNAHKRHNRARNKKEREGGVPYEGGLPTKLLATTRLAKPEPVATTTTIKREPIFVVEPDADDLGVDFRWMEADGSVMAGDEDPVHLLSRLSGIQFTVQPEDSKR